MFVTYVIMSGSSPYHDLRLRFICLSTHNLISLYTQWKQISSEAEQNWI